MTQAMPASSGPNRGTTGSPGLLWTTGRVLILFLVFDLAGVVLTLLADLVAALHIVWESSTLLAYAVWFVTGVFCAMFIAGDPTEGDGDSPEGRRTGWRLIIITLLVAVALGFLSSFVWSASDSAEPVAPDARGVTITYLATVVLVVAWARLVFFRKAAPATTRLPEAAPKKRARLDYVPGAKLVRKARGRPREEEAEFKPTGLFGTLGLLIGVPVLLFLDACFFVLGPFDYFDRWTDLILTTALGGGLAWGFACARWETPRLGLIALHAPPLVGTVFYVFGLLIGGVLVAFGVPSRAAEIVSSASFGIGFLLGGVAIYGFFAAMIEEFRGRAAKAVGARP